MNGRLLGQKLEGLREAQILGDWKDARVGWGLPPAGILSRGSPQLEAWPPQQPFYPFVKATSGQADSLTADTLHSMLYVN